MTIYLPSWRKNMVQVKIAYWLWTFMIFSQRPVIHGQDRVRNKSIKNRSDKEADHG